MTEQEKLNNDLVVVHLVNDAWEDFLKDKKE